MEEGYNLDSSARNPHDAPSPPEGLVAPNAATILQSFPALCHGWYRSAHVHDTCMHEPVFACGIAALSWLRRQVQWPLCLRSPIYPD